MKIKKELINNFDCICFKIIFNVDYVELYQQKENDLTNS